MDSNKKSRDGDLVEDIIQAFESQTFQDVLNNSVNKAIGGKLDDIDARLTTQEVELKHVNACLNRHEQMFRNNKLVFSGLVEGEYDNDKLKSKIIDITRYLGVQINFHDIVECLRIFKRLNRCWRG
jgi:hypothetical protein